MSDRFQDRADRYRTRILEVLAGIEESLESAAESARPVELDQQSVGRLSRMDSMQRQAMALETARRRVHRRLQLRQALKRIDEDDFGYCTSCGEPIPEGRLDIDPAFHLCVNCAKES